ncbi:NAD(P)H-dependent oxidoreductase [Methylobacterium nodulans]|uniref:NAD(P)H dehydrogenase (Quinone) n=1 Tax=Methylobacterium nodulans (strain LMG 21967 / CNCM I-2342 / ORS 2060) TaxID=460265 RepID=B8IWR9_METNO|nr:NAD(P)H-dependent oxidoreductase [Methylobacterium nodulans]ACL62960.1 NAD(P)H dehydrogenase (quinone) [Methylobacterium nodulans ORS 2060]
MRVLLIYSHPCSDSFSSTLRQIAAEALSSAGHEVEVRDLYAESFDPVLSEQERRTYYDESTISEGAGDHVASLRQAQALVFVYPTWWFGSPAMLKGWFDRVWLPGVAFRLSGPNDLQPRLTNIQRIVVVTTYGSPRWLLWLLGWPDWRVFKRAIRTLCAPRCRLEWLSLTGMDNCTDDKRRRFAAKIRVRLSNWK